MGGPGNDTDPYPRQEAPKNPLNLPNILQTASPTTVALLSPSAIRKIIDPLNSSRNQKSKPIMSTRAGSLAPIMPNNLSLAGQLSLQGLTGQMEKSLRKSSVSGRSPG